MCGSGMCIMWEWVDTWVSWNIRWGLKPWSAWDYTGYLIAINNRHTICFNIVWCVILGHIKILVSMVFSFDVSWTKELLKFFFKFFLVHKLPPADPT